MRRTLWLPNPTPYQPLMHPTHSRSQRLQDTLACILAPMTLYICVSASLLYGFYGDTRLVLGPSSSRLMKASSVFVEQVEVTNEYNNGVLLYAFNKKPELSSQTNWSASKFLVVGAYSRKGISLWLNKGSTIRMRWEAPASSINQLEGIVIKGERKFEKLKPKETFFLDAVAGRESVDGKEAEYIVEEDDGYHIGVLNMNARSIILTMNVNVSAKVYDTTKAKKMCSAANGSCRLSLLFPNTYYVILTAPKIGDDDEWYVEVSFIARVIAYVAVLGLFMIVIFLILRCLGVRDVDDHNTNVETYETSNVVAAQEITENEAMTHLKPNPMTYGTNENRDEESDVSSSSSDELYDEKLCIICYDEQRNCFFVPCGHCATCYDCAQRIVDGESKVCPVCRRLIHKVRRLFHS
ncbi:E3 ubiquitin-protein ligase APD2-like isoform X1 [Gastrolobium bilobum]|uniref:E3 ubiquitin-protein ligase APD2-like isoform X1 n=2 Tax=Gastrolobium bilobum TaxID=150636 RepID=UPI002AB09729|nr:E3 ubiquitin-protein ligase APD2-like isoform X1 [Gastrolobium bilobum]